MNAYADTGNRCSMLFNEPQVQSLYRFENGHNVSLRKIMIKLKEYQDSIEEFANALTPQPPSPYLKDRSLEFRTPEALSRTLDLAYKYQKILNHLAEHSSTLMMTPRIEMIPVEKRADFIKKYKESYVVFAEAFKEVVFELEQLQNQSPSEWNNFNLQKTMMTLHSLMGASHDRF